MDGLCAGMPCRCAYGRARIAELEEPARRRPLVVLLHGCRCREKETPRQSATVAARRVRTPAGIAAAFVTWRGISNRRGGAAFVIAGYAPVSIAKGKRGSAVVFQPAENGDSP